jgi:hypothetical protein
MGDTITSYFAGLKSTDDDYDTLLDSEWVATTRINANSGEEFKSWPEFFGPLDFNGDSFTRVQQYNLSNTPFVEVAVGDASDGNFTIHGYGVDQAPANASPPFAAEEIVIVSYYNHTRKSTNR